MVRCGEKGVMGVGSFGFWWVSCRRIGGMSSVSEGHRDVWYKGNSLMNQMLRR